MFMAAAAMFGASDSQESASTRVRAVINGDNLFERTLTLHRYSSADIQGH
jgi:hypothetical protein